MRYIKLYENFKSNFNKWFGNSKMIENNATKVFYHGVGIKGLFDTFRYDLIGTTSSNVGHFGKGFTSLILIIKQKVSPNFMVGEVISVYLKIENPFIVTEENLIYIGEKYNLNLPEKEVKNRY